MSVCCQLDGPTYIHKTVFINTYAYIAVMGEGWWDKLDCCCYSYVYIGKLQANSLSCTVVQLKYTELPNVEIGNEVSLDFGNFSPQLFSAGQAAAWPMRREELQ